MWRGGRSINVLITGYSGLLGRSAARAMKKRGARVRVLLHTQSVPRGEIEHEADEVLRGTLEDSGVIRDALSGIDAVVHTAWRSSKQLDPRPTVNEKIALSLWEHSVRLGIGKFALISSVSVYGMDSSQKEVALTEDAPLALHEAGRFIYPSEKISIETSLAASDRKATKLGIFRLGRLFNDEKGPMRATIRIGRGFIGLGIGAGRNRMPFIHVGDAAEAVAAWVTSAEGDVILNLTPNSYLTHRDWYKAWATANGIRLTPVFIPVPIVSLGSGIARNLFRFFGKPVSHDLRYAVSANTRDLLYSNERAKQALNWNPSLTDRYTQSRR